MNTRHLLAALLATATTALANGGGFLEGVKSTGPFRPVNVDSVEMVSEKLDIELQEDSALVSITYQLHNPGKAVKVKMGFPCSVVMRDTHTKEGESAKPALPELEEFTLAADGRAVEAKAVKDEAKLPGAGPYESMGSRLITGWQVVEVPFSKNQTRTVTVRYRNPYYREIWSISGNSDASAPNMRYLFSAAALWKGPVKWGQVTVRATGVDPDVVRLSHPKRFQREGNQWSWTFADFEPTMQDDLEIVAGECEFTQRHRENDGDGGLYVMRGRTTDRAELRKNGKWFFVGRQYTATASSSLNPDSPKFSYRPENLNDDKWDNAWAEGVEGHGVGESVTLTMKHPQRATRLYIQNGYRKSQALFSQNNRVKKMSVSLNGGKPFSVDLRDGFRAQNRVTIPPDAGVLKTVKMTIVEVYPGTDFQDTCLSSVDVEVPLSKAPPIFPSR
jgi:hypothetical protein